MPKVHTKLCKLTESAPNGILPYINDNNQLVDDSRTIILYLIKKFQFDIDHLLSKKEVLQANRLLAALEKILYPVILYGRLIDKKGLAIFDRDILKPQGITDENVQKIISSFKKGKLKEIMEKKNIDQSCDQINK